MELTQALPQQAYFPVDFPLLDKAKEQAKHIADDISDIADYVITSPKRFGQETKHTIHSLDMIKAAFSDDVYQEKTNIAKKAWNAFSFTLGEAYQRAMSSSLTTKLGWAALLLGTGALLSGCGGKAAIEPTSTPVPTDAPETAFDRLFDGITGHKTNGDAWGVYVRVEDLNQNSIADSADKYWRISEQGFSNSPWNLGEGLQQTQINYNDVFDVVGNDLSNMTVENPAYPTQLNLLTPDHVAQTASHQLSRILSYSSLEPIIKEPLADGFANYLKFSQATVPGANGKIVRQMINPLTGDQFGFELNLSYEGTEIWMPSDPTTWLMREVNANGIFPLDHGNSLEYTNQFVPDAWLFNR